MLRRINAVFSLAAVCIILMHIAMMCGGAINMVLAQPPYVVMILLISIIGTHAVLSVAACIGTGPMKGPYHKIWSGTSMQRMTGIVLIAVAALHIVFNALVSAGVLQGTAAYVITCVIVIVIVNIASTHLAVSFPKAFVTLGMVTSEKTVAGTEKFSKIFFLAVRIFVSVVFIVYIVKIVQAGI